MCVSVGGALLRYGAGKSCWSQQYLLSLNATREEMGKPVTRRLGTGKLLLGMKMKSPTVVWF
jgi:hypothetical protein